MTNQQDSQLKPCPFNCGEEVKFKPKTYPLGQEGGRHFWPDQIVHNCKVLGQQICLRGGTKEQLFDKWNTRAEPSPSRPEQSKAKAINHAIQHGSALVRLFCNDDCTISYELAEQSPPDMVDKQEVELQLRDIVRCVENNYDKKWILKAVGIIEKLLKEPETTHKGDVIERIKEWAKDNTETSSDIWDWAPVIHPEELKDFLESLQQAEQTRSNNCES